MLTNDYGRSRSVSPKAKSQFTNQNTEQNKIENNKGSDKKYRLPSDELITEEVKLKMELVQSLTEPCDRATYSKRKKAVADKLGVSILIR